LAAAADYFLSLTQREPIPGETVPEAYAPAPQAPAAPLADIAQPQYPQQPQVLPQPQAAYIQQNPVQPLSTYDPNWPLKNKTVAGVFAILLGGIGVHKFYMGKVLMGILYLLFCWTFIPSVVGIIEGIEFADCEGIERSISGGKRTKCYYCHPYSNWERGSNEKQNQMLRRRFPKGTNFDDVNEAEVERVEQWLNGYPRKMFGWSNSKQMFDNELQRLRND
jgi:hypothetical protein